MRCIARFAIALGLTPGAVHGVILDHSLDTNPDPASERTLRQTIVGIIYSVTPKFDLDAGVRRGNMPAIDRALLVGTTLRW